MKRGCSDEVQAVPGRLLPRFWKAVGKPCSSAYEVGEGENGVLKRGKAGEALPIGDEVFRVVGQKARSPRLAGFLCVGGSLNHSPLLDCLGLDEPEDSFEG